MKLQNKWFIGAMLGAAVCLVSTSCVDEIKFGNSFLDKAPGGNATIDTVFNSAEYTRQFLNTCYSRQYYGLPYNTDSNGNIPDSSSPYLGKKDALTDCWSLYFSDATVYQQYYLGSLNANYGTRGNIFPYTREMVWEVVRWCWLLMENIDRVPGMDSTEKTQLVAEAKCLIAARYFDMFRHYGGLPLLYASFTGTESGYEIPRATVEETVNYMIKMLDDAITSGGLVWAYADADLASKAGHWTKAGAMALKCKIWQFAASPLFNDVNGYAGGNSEAEQQHLVWYGGYHAELWDNCLKACEAFFKELESQGACRRYRSFLVAGLPSCSGTVSAGISYGIYSSEQQGGLAFCPHEYVGRFQLKFLYVAFLGCSVTLSYRISAYTGICGDVPMGRRYSV